MGYTKDLWTRPDPDDKDKRVPNARWGKGKRWLACWSDGNGGEPSKAFGNYKAATKFWQGMETDVERGDYHDPKAGRELFDDIAKRWFSIRDVDPKTMENYRRVYRLHLKDAIGKRAVKTPKPSEVAQLLAGISPGNRGTAHLILKGVFELARGDGMIRRNPASGQAPAVGGVTRRVQAWGDDVVSKLIDAHPAPLKLAPTILAGCGLRESELYGLSVKDVVADGDDPVIRVRRQIKHLAGGVVVFALPKGDKERDVPLPGWVTAAITAHTRQWKPLAVTLPWETKDGPKVTHELLVTNDGEYMRPSVYRQVWKPALHAAGLIGPKVKRNGRLAWPPDRQAGRHALRHYYASVLLADGVNIRELAEYLGHQDPGFTLRVYGHMLPDSHERARKAIDGRLFRPRAVV